MNIFYQNLVAAILITIGLIKGKNWALHDCIPQFPWIFRSDVPLNIQLSRTGNPALCRDNIVKQRYTIGYFLFALFMIIFGTALIIKNDSSNPDPIRYQAVPICLLATVFLILEKFKSNVPKPFLIFFHIIFALWTLVYLILKSQQNPDKLGMNLFGLFFVIFAFYMYSNFTNKTWWINYYCPFSTSTLFLTFGFILIALAN